jgi:hypothetical protein
MIALMVHAPCGSTVTDAVAGPQGAPSIVNARPESVAVPAPVAVNVQGRFAGVLTHPPSAVKTTLRILAVLAPLAPVRPSMVAAHWCVRSCLLTVTVPVSLILAEGGENENADAGFAPASAMKLAAVMAITVFIHRPSMIWPTIVTLAIGENRKAAGPAATLILSFVATLPTILTASG